MKRRTFMPELDNDSQDEIFGSVAWDLPGHRRQVFKRRQAKRRKVK